MNSASNTHQTKNSYFGEQLEQLEMNNFYIILKCFIFLLMKGLLLSRSDARRHSIFYFTFKEIKQFLWKMWCFLPSWWSLSHFVLLFPPPHDVICFLLRHCSTPLVGFSGVFLPRCNFGLPSIKWDQLWQPPFESTGLFEFCRRDADNCQIRDFRQMFINWEYLLIFKEDHGSVQFLQTTWIPPSNPTCFQLN